MNSVDLLRALKAIANPEKAQTSMRFFKTGKGQYGEGDQFIGITVPEIRKVARKFIDLQLPEISKLLQSKIHEARLCALLILVKKYPDQPAQIFQFYCKHFQFINNWDLVDSSAEYIVGRHLFVNGARMPLRRHVSPFSRIDMSPWRHDSRAGRLPLLLIKLSKSENLWERRIAIISTFYFIKKGEPEPTFRIAEVLIHDKHDLIHKAVGWMLREVGKRISEEIEESFLKKHAATMPRTMLRYAIERFPEDKRRWYLAQGKSQRR